MSRIGNTNVDKLFLQFMLCRMHEEFAQRFVA